METFEVLLNGTLRLIRGEEGMVYPILDGKLLLSKGVTFRPGQTGRCVELDTQVDEDLFRQKVEELAASSGFFSVEPGEEV